MALCFLIAFGFRGRNRDTTKKPSPTVGWATADFILAAKPLVTEVLAEFPPDTEYTASYFKELKRRREAAMAWSVGAQPKLVFLGQVHLNVTSLYGDAPDRVKTIMDIQSRVFENLKLESADAQVIAIEQSGCRQSRQLTLEVYADLTQRYSLYFFGKSPTKEEIKGLMATDRQAATRAIMELRTPVICGEEWPLMLQLAVNRSLGLVAAKQKLGKLMDAFHVLRSEIMLIRTLEALRERGGTKGIMIQGDFHGPDYAALQKTYGVDIRIVAAPQ